MDGCIKLCRVIEVDGDDVWLANVLLCIRMLGGNLGKYKWKQNEGLNQDSFLCFVGFLSILWGAFTFLEVGFPLKNSLLSELRAGLNLGCRKMQPFAIASNGAGPS